MQMTIGVGTTFHIYLPAAEKAITEQRDKDRSVVTGERNILLMDDEESIRNVARELLTLLGYDVDTAKDGEEAIELYRLAKNRMIHTLPLFWTLLFLVEWEERKPFSN